jgi:protein-L-isoaspartate(D-aspartate) O-methyltransferase
VEREEVLARTAQERMGRLGYRNVHILHADGTLGWEENAPYNAIVVAAGGPAVPKSLLSQLAVGGRLVMPVGSSQRAQDLVRVTRTGQDDFRTEELGPVRFVPLIGAEGWEGPQAVSGSHIGMASRAALVAQLIHEVAEPIQEIENADIGSVIERIGGARVVLLGEATHGTSEFYRMRSRITQELIKRCGFNVVAIEGDWPDASRIDRYVRNLPPSASETKAFTRFPTWMWRNKEVHDFCGWLRAHNAGVGDRDRQVGFYGLDLYSLYSSIQAVVEYLESVDPEAARVARWRYGCLTPWEADPAAYGQAAITGNYRICEGEVVAMLQDLMSRHLEYAERDGYRFLDAFQNARLIANGERYYRTMYYGSRESWNLRDQHMFDTLQSILTFRGPESRAVIWAHNSHVGDASATEMGVRGEINIGYLCRRAYGPGAYVIGFGTDHGTVAAASQWGGPRKDWAER